MNCRLAPLSLAAALMVIGLCQARAQSTNLDTANVSTCNVKGTVTVTVLGAPAVLPVICLNETQQTAPGVDESAVIGTQTIGIPMIANIASVNAPYGTSKWQNAINATALTGGAQLEDIGLVQNGVTADGVAGYFACASGSSTNEVHCAAGTEIATLMVAGQPVTLPQAPIPVNYQIPIADLNVQVNVLGIGLLSVPLNGALTLNKVTTSGLGTSTVLVDHAALSLTLSGGVNTLLGPVTVAINLDDFSSTTMSLETELLAEAFNVNFETARRLQSGAAQRELIVSVGGTPE